jgi:hypothetical protein
MATFESTLTFKQAFIFIQSKMIFQCIFISQYFFATLYKFWFSRPNKMFLYFCLLPPHLQGSTSCIFQFIKILCMVHCPEGCASDLYHYINNLKFVCFFRGSNLCSSMLIFIYWLIRWN